MAIYKGDKEIVGLYKGPTEIIKRYKGSNLIYNVFKWLPYSYEHIYNSLVPQYINKSKIPEEYQEVEYIESTGTQYINIGYAPKFDDSIKITLMPLQTLVDLAFFGVYDGPAQACELGQVGHGFRGNVSEENAPRIVVGQKFTFRYVNGKWSYNGQEFGNPQSANASNNALLFGRYYDNGVTKLNTARVYRVEITNNNDVMVRDLVPCYRKSDNVIGLYDRANNAFYANAGTGTFLKGTDVKRTVKDKAQVNTIYGNSVVENQLVPNDKIEQVIIFETTDTNPKPIVNIDFIAGHKYLITCEQSATLSSNTRNTFTIGANYETTQSNANLQKGIRKWIYTHSGDGTALYIWCHSPNIQVSFTNFNIIDLTQWFPFNTPTTLTDTRVQEIISRGHILYNAGTLKNVDIGEISSESYNLFDGELEQGGLGNGQPFNSTTNVRSKNFTKVIGGKTYTFEESATSNKWKNRYVAQYDADKNHIRDVGFGNSVGGFGKAYSAALDSNCRYVKLKYYAEQAITPSDFHDVCFHKTSTRTGYASIKTFNLWNEETVLALLQYDKNASNFGQQISGSNITSKNYINVLPNKEYSVSGATAQANMVLFCYDENKNAIIVGNSGYIAIKSNGQTFTTPSGCRYVRFYMSNPYGTTYNHDICINVSGNKNGTYMPYGVVDKLSFSYQGSGVGTAHDTLEITETEYAFTKNITEDNLSNYAFYYADSTKFLYTTRELNGCRTDSIWSPNALTNISGYKLVDSNKLSDNDVACTIYAGKFYIRNDALTEQQLKDVVANKTIKYQLAKPQVVRIPKKHLAVVDMGTMAWEKRPSNGRMYSPSLEGIIKLNTNYWGCPNLFCAKYTTDTPENLESSSPTDKTISMGGNGYSILIYDSDYADATAFKQAMSGVYLFYETEDEVDDILSDINIEAGGSITTNWFSWVENQNALPLTSNKWVSPSAYGTLTDATATSVLYTRNQTDYSGNVPLIFQAIEGGYGSIAGHKYLIKCTITPSASFKFRAYIGTYGNVYSPVANVKNYFTEIITANSNGYLQFISENGGHLPLGGTVLFENVQCIDLTLGFGAGKEPTSINDPRIQYIIKQGYIPTNTTGTNKSVASEVLPNIDFKIKCR